MYMAFINFWDFIVGFGAANSIYLYKCYISFEIQKSPACFDAKPTTTADKKSYSNVYSFVLLYCSCCCCCCFTRLCTESCHKYG